MKKYDIRIRRDSFQEKRITSFKNFDVVSRRYRKARLRNLWIRIFYLLFLIGISVLLFIFFQ